MKSRPTFDPWPDKDYAFFPPKQSSNWLPWAVIGILGVGVGISVFLLWTA